MSANSTALRVADPNAPVIYLDFDGVLHHQEVYMNAEGYIFMDAPQREAGRRLFEWCHLLATLLRDKPQVQIVLSTTWARKIGMQSTIRSLMERLDANVIGSTFEARIDGANDEALEHFLNLSRSQQIQRDVARRGIKNWIAIDDDFAGWPAHSADRLIPCDGDWGISNPKTYLLLEQKLEAMCIQSVHVSKEVVTTSSQMPRISFRRRTA